VRSGFAPLVVPPFVVALFVVAAGGALGAIGAGLRIGVIIMSLTILIGIGIAAQVPCDRVQFSRPSIGKLFQPGLPVEFFVAFFLFGVRFLLPFASGVRIVRTRLLIALSVRGVLIRCRGVPVPLCGGLVWCRLLWIGVAVCDIRWRAGSGFRLIPRP